MYCELGSGELIVLRFNGPKEEIKTRCLILESYDSEKFWNEEAQNLNTAFITRPIVKKRGVDMSQENYDVGEEITRRGGMNFYKHRMMR